MGCVLRTWWDSYPSLLASILLTWTESPYEMWGTLLYIVHILYTFIYTWQNNKFYYVTTLTLIRLNGYKNLPLCFTKAINRVTPVGCFRQKAQAAQLHTRDMSHAPHPLMANSQFGIRFKLPETPSSPSAVTAAAALSQAPRHVFFSPTASSASTCRLRTGDLSWTHHSSASAWAYVQGVMKLVPGCQAD